MIQGIPQFSGRQIGRIGLGAASGVTRETGSVNLGQARVRESNL